MLAVIAYSCFTSAYFVAFSFNKDQPIIYNLEHLVFASYTVDIIINFIRVPSNEEMASYPAETNPRSHALIFKRYLLTGRFIMDVTATFPFYLFEVSNSSFLKLLRMTRLPKILNLVDQKRMSRLIDFLIQKLPHDKQISYRIRIQQGFSVLSLMLITIIFTFFTGCGFYFIAAMGWNRDYFDPNFLTLLRSEKAQYPAWDEDTDVEFYDMITVIYFSITTLSTVGYGDLTAQSNIEKCVAMLVMFAGVGFFSYIMGEFI